MIFEYALEPALVASWHDPAKWRFFDGKFGIGTRRVVCALPSPGWRDMVLQAFEDETKGADPAARQTARKRLDVLLEHVSRDMTKRAQMAPTGSSWLDAAVAEHGAYPFQGILARSFATKGDFALAADALTETSSPRWSPRHASTLRQVHDVSQALSPILRSCTEARFIDPYFDASIRDFSEPFASFLALLQQRRDPERIKIEVHTAPRADGAWKKPADVAQEKIRDCRTAFAPLLKPGVSLRVFVWSEGVPGGDKLHNRYILTNQGGVAVQSGLDRSHPSSPHTDDLTLLSREQYLRRWDQYREGSKAFRLVLPAPGVITAADAGGAAATSPIAKPTTTPPKR